MQTTILILINFNLYFVFPESTRPKGNNRRRDYPRGGYDVGPIAAPSMASGGYAHHSGGDPRKQFKGQGGRRQRRNQTSQSQSLSSPGFGSTDPYAGGASSKPSVMLEDEFEVGSVFNSGSKKQNISHLMNFQFEPRGSQTNKKSAGSKNFFRKSSGESEFCNSTCVLALNLEVL